MNFTLPISPEYVAHWGLWEAVREIYQNALDEQTLDLENKATIEYDGAILRVSTPKGQLTPDSLVLGNTSKRQKAELRGKFGEGYKLALLVLVRLGFSVEILTGNDWWLPKLEHSDVFNSTVLTIETQTRNENCVGVTFLIGGVQPSQWAEIQRNIRQPSELNWVLEEDAEKGRIYVGGLYVSTAKRFHCGYAFVPGRIKLDRDRGMVDGFDLAYETSKLWENKGSTKAIELLNAEAPDVEYLESHVNPASTIVSYHAEHFYRNHGNAIPVSSQDEIERASNAGVKWVLVPEKVKSLLRLVRSWFIPTSKSPVEQLRDFRKKHEWRMDREMKQDLDEIIRNMSPEEVFVADNQ